MELRQLRHFLAVLEAGSLHRAAKKLNISEPALSKSISRLEEFLKVPLLEQSTRRGGSYRSSARRLGNDRNRRPHEVPVGRATAPGPIADHL